MPNNRLLAKEEVATYSGMLLDAALEQGGAERVLEVREQLDFVLRTYRGNADLREALGTPLSSDTRWPSTCSMVSILWPSALSLSWLSVATSTSFLLP